MARNFLHRVVEIQCAGNGAFYFVVGGVADQRVAGANVEIDVGQRFDAEVVFRVVGLDLGGELEEEAQFADFHRLFHDVHAEEVVQNYAFENEVTALRVR